MEVAPISLGGKHPEGRPQVHGYRGRALGTTLTILATIFLVVGCGPCSALRRDFDQRWRDELTYLALGERVTASETPHAELIIGSSAFAAMTALALQDGELASSTTQIAVPASSWSKGGTLSLDLDVRIDRVNTLQLLESHAENDAELMLTTLVHARFEVPGRRSRWSWGARANVRVPLHADGDGLIRASFEDADIVDLDARLPWTLDDVPADIGALVESGIRDAIDALLHTKQTTSVVVASIRPLALARATIPVHIQSVRIDPDSGNVLLGLNTALRPRGLAARPPEQPIVVDPDEVALRVPSATLDAAVRQQALRGGTPTSVEYEVRHSELRWVALWNPSSMHDGVWNGDWTLWCVDARPCKKRHLDLHVRAWAHNGGVVSARDPVDDEDRAVDPTTAVDTAASLAELTRMTMVDMVVGVTSWFSQERASADGAASLVDLRLERDTMDARFRLR